MRSTLLILPFGAAALPVIRPKLSADSFAVFADPPPRYPQIPDALNALCRNLAALTRPSEMDRYYRTKELSRKLRADPSAFCGETVAARMNTWRSC
jgi:hypothetical protein